MTTIILQTKTAAMMVRAVVLAASRELARSRAATVEAQPPAALPLAPRRRQAVPLLAVLCNAVLQAAQASCRQQQVAAQRRVAMFQALLRSKALPHLMLSWCHSQGSMARRTMMLHPALARSKALPHSMKK